MSNQDLPKDTDWNHFWGREQSEKFQQISWSKRRILSILQPYMKAGQKALDAGCGSGFFSNIFCENDLEVFSLDYSKNALEVAEKITQGRSRLVQADMLQDDLSQIIKEPVDIIFSDGLFEHFSQEDQDKIMRNLVQVLAKNGVIVTFVPNKWSPWELIRPFFMPGIEEEPFVIKELVDLNERNGLKVVEKGGINTIPFRLSPDRLIGQTFGMLLYTVARN
ncbi:MAG: class I SAM-dependent methyltransferase [Candidatus Omnitrophica bacterium]|nr:class I SAM-dependent methyltransferase [Candidatus Omnitrophota bacterium]